MLNLSVLKYLRYVADSLAECMNIIGMYIIIFVMPLFFQNGLGLSVAVTGTIMRTDSLVVIVAMPFVTKILTVW